jgi:serine/threonine protein kinase
MIRFGGLSQKYRLGDRIGGGSFGEIYEVRNLKTGEDCAGKEEVIKILNQPKRWNDELVQKDTDCSMKQNDGTEHSKKSAECSK